MDPALCVNHRNLDRRRALENARLGTGAAQTRLGVPVIVEPEEMVATPDEHAMMTYVALFRDLERKGAFRPKCRVIMPATTGKLLPGQRCEFGVDVPPDCRGKLQVRVIGPHTEAKPEVVRGADGQYAVSFVPSEAGQWRVHVMLDGEDVKGSPFTVTVDAPPAPVVPEKKFVDKTQVVYTTFLHRGTHCGKCRTKYTDDKQKYCGVCGEPAYDAPRRCPNKQCRAILEIGQTRCSACGSSTGLTVI
jgi:hypothetical protein